jgi:hypothetical protein
LLGCLIFQGITLRLCILLHFFLFSDHKLFLSFSDLAIFD